MPDEPTLAARRHGITTQSDRMNRGRSWAIVALSSLIALTGGAAFTQKYWPAQAATPMQGAPLAAAPLPAAASDPPVAAPTSRAASAPDFELINVIDPSKPVSSSAAKTLPRRPVASPQPGKPATRPKFLNSRD